MADAGPVLAVGDERRNGLRRAVFATLAAVAACTCFTATKGVKPLYAHAPWENDPYDTVLTFTMFFVPVVAGVLLVRVSLCRRSEALALGRVASILRGCRVAVGTIAAELLSAWVAVGVGANRSEWTNRSTGFLLALLVGSSVATAWAVVHLARVAALSTRPTCDAPDWVTDVVLAAERESRWLGPLRSPGLRVLRWANRSVASLVRRHTIVAALAASIAFGGIVFSWQGYREGYGASVTALAVGLGFCGMFAFLMVAGSYLELVRSTRPLSGTPRRLVDSLVVGCVAAIGALAFRSSLWWAVGTTDDRAGPSRFAALVGLAVLTASAATFVVERLAHAHGDRDLPRKLRRAVPRSARAGTRQP